MKTFALILILLAAEKSGWQDNLMKMVETERAFGRHCAQIGQHQATYEAMDDKGILFREHPINGKKSISETKAPPIILKFDPEYADISAAGDMGYTCGPWEFQSALPLTEPIQYGYYATIWKRQENGDFKVAIAHAIGIGKTMPEHYSYKLKTPKPSVIRTAKNNPADNLKEIDEAYSNRWQANPASEVYTGAMLPDAIFLRVNMFPTRSGSDVKRKLAEVRDLKWKPIDSETSKSNDFGYSYGSYELINASNAVETGYYIKYWKRDSGGNWKVAVDMYKPLSKKQG